ncbi:MAG: diaminobutyrate acetyltransferase [Gammaproteobacteria bacterium]|nr:diaminobutyrate acetyltransferase [Gammaproteobacteria bacterium]
MGNSKEQIDRQIELRPPSATDGAAVSRLISHCPPLDTNSMYCNLLQCTHFSSTSVAAIENDKLVGFISCHVIPERKNTLFIWQVAVCDKARGQGLASRMLKHILDRSLCEEVNYLETTITESNQASWSLFKSLAKKLNSELNTSVMFDCDKHFSGEHDTELLARIGPFNYHTVE